jgi:phosphotransferase system HPr-like phosphotransfer protein
MGLKGGDTIILQIEGEDEQDAGEAINKFFNEELKHL